MELSEVKCKCGEDADVFLVDSNTRELIIALCNPCKDNIDLIIKREVHEVSDNDNIH